MKNADVALQDPNLALTVRAFSVKDGLSQPFDVLVWDNASVQHKARGDYPVGEPRRFWRHMIEGERPR